MNLDLREVARQQNDADHAAGLLPSRYIEDDVVLHRVAGLLVDPRDTSSGPGIPAARPALVPGVRSAHSPVAVAPVGLDVRPPAEDSRCSTPTSTAESTSPGGGGRRAAAAQ